MSEFKIDDIIMKIGGDVRYTVTGVFSDWYDVASDSPIPDQPWVMKKDARREFVKVGRRNLCDGTEEDDDE